MDLTVQGGQSPPSYMQSAADWPPPISRVPRKPKVAQFCAAPWPNFTPPLTPMAVKHIEVGATEFARHFPKMKEDVREYDIISVMSHNRTVRAFISPSVFAELEELRRRKRELERLEDMDAAFFDALDEAVALYDETA